MNDLERMCKRIVNELVAVDNNKLFKFNGNTYNVDEVEEAENDEGYAGYIIDDEFVDEDEVEFITFWNYFDDVLDIEYTVDSRKEYKSVCLMVTCGGPNIYINTNTHNVEGRWWNEKCDLYYGSDISASIDCVFEEYFNCI